MDKETLSNYGWIVICVMVLAVMIALATPFGSFIKRGVQNTAEGLFSSNQKALSAVNIDIGDNKFNDIKLLEVNDYKKDDTNPVRFKSSAPLNTFTELRIDGVVVDAANYTLSEGSTIVDVSPTFMNGLAEDFHDVTIVSDIDGEAKEATGEFEVFTPPSTSVPYITDDYNYTYVAEGEDGYWTVAVKSDRKGQSSFGSILPKVKGAPVTSLENTFSGCSSLVIAPEIPESVDSMAYTFAGCSSLTTAPVLPSGLKGMTSTFNSCTSLTEAPAIPNGVLIMINTFNGCRSLTNAPTIPNSVTNASGAFAKCTSLTNAPTIPNSVTNLSGIFSGCTSLVTAPAIPSGVTGITNMFNGCTSLVNAPEIPSGITSTSGMFSGCTSLVTAPAIPNGVSDISQMFNGCTSLVNAPVIPGSVKNMMKTFISCHALVNAPEIPYGVTNMSNTFADCTSLAAAPAIPSSCSTSPAMIFRWCSQLGY